jgi:hypothetical protein
MTASHRRSFTTKFVNTTAFMAVVGGVVGSTKGLYNEVLAPPLNLVLQRYYHRASPDKCAQQVVVVHVSLKPMQHSGKSAHARLLKLLTLSLELPA